MHNRCRGVNTLLWNDMDRQARFLVWFYRGVGVRKKKKLLAIVGELLQVVATWRLFWSYEPLFQAS